MKIIEQHLLSKKGEVSGGEDRICVTSRGDVLVVDGATQKTPYDFNGKSGGLLTAEICVATLSELCGNESPRQIVDAFTEAVLRDLFERFKLQLKPGEDLPACSLVLYAAHLDSIIRVGDCPFAINGVANYGSKLIDTVNSELRAAVNNALLQSGRMTKDEIAADDQGREAILGLLLRQPLFMNQVAAGRFGYGCITSSPVPDEFIEVYPVPKGAEVILASDGYPEILPTLAASEKYLAEYLVSDPLMIGKHASTKGLAKGQVSYDDRAYIRFTS
jgi:hypothetical protein